MRSLLSAMRLQVQINKERQERGHWFQDARCEIVYATLLGAYNVDTEEGANQVAKFFTIAEIFSQKG